MRYVSADVKSFRNITYVKNLTTVKYSLKCSISNNYFVAILLPTWMPNMELMQKTTAEIRMGRILSGATPLISTLIGNSVEYSNVVSIYTYI